MKIVIFSFVTFIFLLHIALAEDLQPGEGGFEILGIIITPLQSNEDYTGTNQVLGLFGDLSYLNIKWNAHYSDNIERDIGVDCYMNCLNPGKDIQTNCQAQNTPTNHCNYVSKTGYGFCTIVNPNYLYKDQLNNVTCRFYDPSKPQIKYLPYPNRTFYPFQSFVYTTYNSTITLGSAFILDLKIIYYGMIPTNFTSNVSILPNKEGIVLGKIENPIGYIGQLKYNDIGRVGPKIMILSSDKTDIDVLTRADTNPVICYSNGDCGTNYQARINKCRLC